MSQLSIHRLDELLKQLRGIPDQQVKDYLRMCSSANGYSGNAYAIDPSGSHDDLEVDGGLCREKHLHKEVMLQPPWLPPEICAMIVDKYYEAVFIPGKLKPDCTMPFIGQDRFSYDSYLSWNQKGMASLDPRLYEDYKVRYWTHNTFVSGLLSCTIVCQQD